METTLSVSLPAEQQKKLKLIESEVDKLGGFKIENNDQYVQSADLLKRVKGYSSELNDSMMGITRPIDAAKAAARAWFMPTIDRLSAIETAIKKSAIAYQIDQERIRAEAERKAQAEAAEKEAKLRAVKEEQERKLREKEAAARAEAERLAAAGNAEAAAKALEAAAKAAAKADEKAEQAAAVFVPAPVFAPTLPKVAGISTKKAWKARIVSYAAVPRESYINDTKVQEAIQGVLNRFAAATSGGVVVPGVQFYQDANMAAGRS